MAGKRPLNVSHEVISSKHSDPSAHRTGPFNAAERSGIAGISRGWSYSPSSSLNCGQELYCSHGRPPSESTISSTLLCWKAPILRPIPYPASIMVVPSPHYDDSSPVYSTSEASRPSSVASKKSRLSDRTRNTEAVTTSEASRPSSVASKKSSLSDRARNTEAVTTSEASRPSSVASKKRSLSDRARSIAAFISSQWLILGLGVLFAIASQVQVPASQQQLKGTVVTYLCISVIFFITGCTLPTRVLLRNYRRWRIHVFVQILIFLITSALAFGVVSALATRRNITDPGLLVGFVFMGCVATSISSNVIMTRQAHGNTALTVVSTTLSNFTGVFITPALVVMYTSVNSWYTAVLPSLSNDFQGIYGRVLMQLGLSMYLPLVVGQIVRHFFPKSCDKIFSHWHGSKLSAVSLLIISWSTYDQAFATHAFSSLSKTSIIILIFINIALFVIYFLATIFLARAWLPREDVVAICYCVPAKAITMGVPICKNLFAETSLRLESQILIPLIVYQLLQYTFGSLLIPVFRRWLAKGEREVNLNGDNAAVDDNESASAGGGRGVNKTGVNSNRDNAAVDDNESGPAGVERGVDKTRDTGF